MRTLVNQAMVFEKGLYRAKRTIKQSKLFIISDLPQAIGAAVNSVIYHRYLLEEYIQHNPIYQFSLEPVKVEERAPQIVKLAAYAGEIAGIGPMAAVPGALAELAVGEMTSYGSRVNIVENGGEIAAHSNRSINVGIYAGSTPLSGRIGFHLSVGDFPIGIATSSATVSHALSLGEADAAVVIADSASIADAAATAVCNNVRGRDVEASIQAGLELAETIPHVRSALILRGEYIGKVGKVPRIIRLDCNLDELFKANPWDVIPSEVSLSEEAGINLELGKNQWFEII